ncbi:hypothetical protein F2P81_015348 [Scophthalmus maximus]|uniref:Uncharacterized protein n=1 Tax=Scophthalmus maximus TaxID=52904 RepID=A0A6A4SLR0_SCOMX|nr:hypothetical protein F2P81_015348 [Scophthalmus maximus]
MDSLGSRCKIVVVGDTQCGKTALLHVFAKDCYPELMYHRNIRGLSVRRAELKAHFVALGKRKEDGRMEEMHCELFEKEEEKD